MLQGKLNAYPQSMVYWEGESKPELVAKMGVSKPHANNNRIEGLNGTPRERVKIQRGVGRIRVEGRRRDEDSVCVTRPHTALEEQTPAERAGVGIEDKDKWMELLKKSDLFRRVEPIPMEGKETMARERHSEGS